jgi:hypothetical protein
MAATNAVFLTLVDLVVASEVEAAGTTQHDPRTHLVASLTVAWTGRTIWTLLHRIHGA